jgi:hypothetical protein
MSLSAKHGDHHGPSRLTHLEHENTRLRRSIDEFLSAYTAKYRRVRGDLRSDAPMFAEVQKLKAEFDR